MNGTSGWIYTTELTRAALGSLLDPQAYCYILVSRPEEYCFDFFAHFLQRGERPLTWPRGRVFATGQELRWEQAEHTEEHFHVSFLTEAAQGAPFTPERERTCQVQTYDFFLWGERRTGQERWKEIRIPQWLDYPIAQKKPPGRRSTRVKISARRYLYHGICCALRYAEVREEVMRR